MLSQNRSGARHHFMYDGLGSTRSLTNSSGNASDHYYYDAFGNKAMVVQVGDSLGKPCGDPVM